MFCEANVGNMLAVEEWAIIRDPFVPSNFLLSSVSDSKVLHSHHLWIYTFTNSLSLHAPESNFFLVSLCDWFLSRIFPRATAET